MATQRTTPEEAKARARIRALSEGVRVWKLADDRYAAPSCSTLGLAYEITIHPGSDLACSCPGATHHGVCKHQEAVALMLEAEVAMAAASEARSRAEVADLFN